MNDRIFNDRLCEWQQTLFNRWQAELCQADAECDEDCEDDDIEDDGGE